MECEFGEQRSNEPEIQTAIQVIKNGKAMDFVEVYQEFLKDYGHKV